MKEYSYFVPNLKGDEFLLIQGSPVQSAPVPKNRMPCKPWPHLCSPLIVEKVRIELSINTIKALPITAPLPFPWPIHEHTLITEPESV